MAKASVTLSNAGATSIRPDEAAHFGALAAEWWDPKGSSAMLHRLNPARLSFIRAQIDAHWGGDAAALRPLTGKRAIDVGCGAGLLAEPLARLGASVTGVDAAPENVAVATAHAVQQGLAIDYRQGDITDPAFSTSFGTFDVVTSMEVIEHVEEPQAFLVALAGMLAADGLMILSTPNRTLASRLLLVEAAERLGKVPRGTHDWHRFVTPEELTDMAGQCGLCVVDVSGLSPDLRTGAFRTGGTRTLDYLMTLKRA